MQEYIDYAIESDLIKWCGHLLAQGLWAASIREDDTPLEYFAEVLKDGQTSGLTMRAGGEVESDPVRALDVMSHNSAGYDAWVSVFDVYSMYSQNNAETGNIDIYEPKDNIQVNGWIDDMTVPIQVQQQYLPAHQGEFKMLGIPVFSVEDEILGKGYSRDLRDALREGFMLHKEAAAAYQD